MKSALFLESLTVKIPAFSEHSKSSNNENKFIKSFKESFKFISLNSELSIFSTENLKQIE